MIGTAVIEVSVMLAVDKYLEAFACHSYADFEWLTSFEWKYSTSFFVFFVKSVDDDNKGIRNVWKYNWRTG